MTVKAEDYNTCFLVSPTGREILEDLKKAHHYYDSSFSVDAYTTAFQEGERNVVLRILTILKQHEEELKNGRTSG